MEEKTEGEMEVDTDMDKEKGNEKKEEEEGETESKKNEGKASRSSSPTELASAAATDATSSSKKRPPSPDGEKSEEKAREATTEEERRGKRPRVEGLELEVEAQIELKITEGAAGSRLKIEKVVQKLVEERLRVLELTVFDRTLQELKERVEKIDCATKHQGTLNTLQARITRLVKKFGAANQASENSRKVQEEVMPFAVVGSDKEYQVNNGSWDGKQHVKTAVENLNHSEFSLLRDFIIRSHLQDLKEVTHNIHYETYRAKRLNDNGGLHPISTAADTQESNL
ncbi:activating transcription factor 7-interacting protein 1-like isoform X3 [Alosa sapidissima]|uniref:activating transcription factor 7-interacting protein 1-like isoform X3 n=1 Tax=Alosa sapidissima TaxID=34773 RepID=UPI001C095C96|nr:activating transcription factor 7-interacting protein 1-like isoform X3 [Alosa sapidissima]